MRVSRTYPKSVGRLPNVLPGQLRGHVADAADDALLANLGPARSAQTPRPVASCAWSCRQHLQATSKRVVAPAITLGR
jgi:hypothetical protein